MPPDKAEDAGLSETTQQKLREAAVSDEMAIFGLMYDRHMPKIYAYVARRTANPSEAEDLTADIFERALKTFRTYDPSRAPFEVWLIVIARNAIAKYYRSRRGREHTTLEAMYQIESPGPSPEEAAIQKQQTELVRRGMQELSNRHREILTLRLQSRLTSQQIAKLTGLTETNVRKIVERSLRKLGRYLNERA